jgi:hypothetical protein
MTETDRIACVLQTVEIRRFPSLRVPCPAACHLSFEMQLQCQIAKKHPDMAAVCKQATQTHQTPEISAEIAR